MKPIKKYFKQILLLAGCLGTLLVAVVCVAVILLVRSPGFGFVAMQADSMLNSGTWEDDPQNWTRAFGVDQPPDLKVVHSYYWRSNHFTYEYIYFFEVDATAEWRDSYLSKHSFTAVDPANARSFRDRVGYSDTPAWFAPNPVELYEVWDREGEAGSLWINKETGNIFFYGVQL